MVRHNIFSRLSQSQATWPHCGQEICIESQEISVIVQLGLAFIVQLGLGFS